jgi:hypothetical protein
MAINSNASTVFGLVFGPDGNPSASSALLFTPSTRRPRTSQGGLIGSGSVEMNTNGQGFFTGTLMPGRYYLRVDDGDPIPLVVPSTAGTYVIQDLLGVSGGTVTAGVNYRDIGAQRQLLSSNGAWYVPSVTVSGGAAAISYALGSDAGGTVNYRFRSSMYELAGTDSQYRAPYVTGTASAPALALAAVGATAFANSRVSAGKFQLNNPTTGTWHTWFLNGVAGALGPAES